MVFLLRFLNLFILKLVLYLFGYFFDVSIIYKEYFCLNFVFIFFKFFFFVFIIIFISLFFISGKIVWVFGFLKCVLNFKIFGFFFVRISFLYSIFLKGCFFFCMLYIVLSIMFFNIFLKIVLLISLDGEKVFILFVFGFLLLLSVFLWFFVVVRGMIFLLLEIINIEIFLFKR